MELNYDPNQPLNLKISLLMGQAFRWRQEGEWFSGVAQGHFIKIRKISDGSLEFHSQSSPNAGVADLLRSYLRLDEDVQASYEEISARDPKIAELVRKYSGLRILRQEPWECLIAYICSSANSDITRIARNVETLAANFGDCTTLDGQVRHTFPSHAKLIDAGESNLENILSGPRSFAVNITKAAQRVTEGSLDLGTLRHMPYQEAKARLMEGRIGRKVSNGIGPKVADCILLFSSDKLEAFPVDTNIGQALVDWYFPDLKPPGGQKLRDYELRKLGKQAQEIFGRYAGYAGQYLFHGWRMQK